MELRTEHMVDYLRVTREEAITTSNLLADIRDLLDERLPSGVDHPGGQANELNNTDEGAGEPITVHDDEPVEPPVGSQVIDKDGNVIGRHEDGWRLWLDGLGVWDRHREPWEDLLRRLGYPPRLATDADRERVGLPADTAPGVGVTEADEALARVLFDVSEDHGDGTFAWSTALAMARAAREHFTDWRADEVERLLAAEENAAEHQTARWIAEAERDEWQREFDQTDSLLARTRDERDMYASRAGQWEARHAALRGDVDRGRINARTVAGAAPFTRILDRDDERGQS